MVLSLFAPEPFLSLVSQGRRGLAIARTRYCSQDDISAAMCIVLEMVIIGLALRRIFIFITHVTILLCPSIFYINGSTFERRSLR